MAEVAENTTLAPIVLTDGAVKALNRIRQEQGIPADHYLRVGIKGGGCSGFSYVLGFDLKKEGDQEFMINDQVVIMQKAHQLYLLGITIDWEDGLGNRGFTFTNPNAKETCGCGTSFSA